jgi:hypothetical protein
MIEVVHYCSWESPLWQKEKGSSTWSYLRSRDTLYRWRSWDTCTDGDLQEPSRQAQWRFDFLFLVDYISHLSEAKKGGFPKVASLRYHSPVKIWPGLSFSGVRGFGSETRMWLKLERGRFIGWSKSTHSNPSWLREARANRQKQASLSAVRDCWDPDPDGFPTQTSTVVGVWSGLLGLIW